MINIPLFIGFQHVSTIRVVDFATIHSRNTSIIFVLDLGSLNPQGYAVDFSLGKALHQRPGRIHRDTVIYPLVMADITIEHGQFIVDLPIKDGDFSIVMLVYQTV